MLILLMRNHKGEFMKTYTVAVLGASGAVGKAMIQALEERNFPLKRLVLLASERSVGKRILFKGKEVFIQKTDEHSFDDCDIVLGAVGNDLSKKYAPFIKKAHALFIDNSSAFRLEDDVPLVVPEINGTDILHHQGIIANPNCSTIIGCIAIYALHQLSSIQSMIVSTYQAVSGAGIKGMYEYEKQLEDLTQNKEINTDVFPYQIVSNVIPQIGEFNENGYTGEEMKMQNEGRKILHAPQLNVNCTCVRVPVLRSHSLSMTLYFEKEITVGEVREALRSAQGCRLIDEPFYPMPLDCSNQDLIYVGRIRRDLTSSKGITLWCCGDQIRKGAAVNAIQICEKYIELEV